MAVLRAGRRIRRLFEMAVLRAEVIRLMVHLGALRLLARRIRYELFDARLDASEVLPRRKRDAGRPGAWFCRKAVGGRCILDWRCLAAFKMAVYPPAL